MYFKDRYKITNDLINSKITKEYDYHPYIEKEEIFGGEKTVFFKERYSLWRGYKELVYSGGRIIKKKKNNDEVWEVAVDGKETLNGKEYDPVAKTLTYTTTEQLGDPLYT